MSAKERGKDKTISRRDFLKVVGTGAFGVSLPNYLNRQVSEDPRGKDEAEEYIVLNEKIEDIIGKVYPLGFDSDGNLLNLADKEEEALLTIIPTERNKVERKNVWATKLLVVHYDAAPRYSLSGKERTALNTLWGLNGNDPDGNGLASTLHWCIDNFPIRHEERKRYFADAKLTDEGYGILQTQEASGDPQKPYMGVHVAIGELDDRRFKTIRLFEEIGATSNLKELAERNITDFNRYTVGFEQVGTAFEDSFPYEPPAKQMANVLSLTIAVMREFDLTPWDVVGHNEIQYKSDPGYLFMSTLRYLIGVAALKGLLPGKLVFRGEGKKKQYFEKIVSYLSKVDKKGRLEEWKTYVGYYPLLFSIDKFNQQRKSEMERDEIIEKLLRGTNSPY